MAMGGAESDLGGRQFPSTCWTQFLGGGRTGAAGRRAAESLAQRYWKPIYAFIRSQWAKSAEDAKDLTQEFFVWMLESDFLSRADRTRGRFRSFVKVALRHFLTNEARDTRRIKRGGGRDIVSLDGVPDDSLPGGEPAGAKAKTPEEILDEAWKNETLLRTASTLGEALRAEGKGVYYDVFRDYFLAGAAGLNYRALAERYAISEVDVSNFLMHAKNRYRAILTDIVAETVENEEELRDELKALFGEEKA